MVQPMNYNIDVMNPIQSAVAGLEVGSLFRQAGQQAQEQQRLRERQQMLQKDLSSAIGSSDPKVYSTLITKYPEFADQFKSSYEILNKSEQQNRVQQASQVFSAIDAGRVDIAKDLLQRQADAYMNSGREQEAQPLMDLISTIDLDPDLAKTTAGLLLASTPEGAEILNQFRSQEKLPTEIEKEAVGIEKIRAETDKLIAEAGGVGKLSPKEQNDLAAKFRKEYSDQTKEFKKVQDAFDRVSASEETAAGDLSLIFSYMKMLDPGSVVREGEFATAQNAAGVPSRIVNAYNNALRGTRLNPDQRKEFTSQAKKLFSAAKAREVDIRKGISRIANKAGIPDEDLFYLQDEPTTEPTTGGFDYSTRPYGEFGK